jgi:hypothetical protein
MPSSISTNTYLWINTWQRWGERPGAPLARALVVCILTGLAAGVLSAYSLTETDLRRRLEQQGSQDFVIRWHGFGTPDGGLGRLRSRFRTLEEYGVSIPMIMQSERVRTDIDDQSGPVVWISPTHWHVAFAGEAPEKGAWASDRLSPGIGVRPTGWPLGAQVLSARLAQPLRPLLGRTALLQRDTNSVSSGSIAEAVLVFTRKDGAPAIEYLVEAMRIVMRLDGLEKIDLRGPELLLEQIRELQQVQSVLRFIMGSLMGAAIAVVFGTLAVLEYRETQQVIGLLRSLGAATRLILWQKYLADALLANGCFALALGLWRLLAPHLFVGLGFAPDMVLSVTELWASADMLILWACLNLGVGCGLVPVIRSVLVPIGRIL